MNKSRKRKTSKYLTGGQAAVQCLKKEQVRHVFGLIGSATMEMFDALYYEKNIKFIGVEMKEVAHTWLTVMLGH